MERALHPLLPIQMAAPGTYSTKPLRSFELRRFGPSHLGLGVSGMAHWRLVGWKIALLGAHAATAQSVALTPLNSWMMGSMPGGPTGGFLGVMAVASVVMIPLQWAGGFLGQAVLCWVLLPFAYLALRLVSEPLSQDTVGWIAGSVVAGLQWSMSLFALGLTIGVTGNGPPAMGLLLVAQAGGGLVSLIAAQAGGYLGSLHGLRRRRLPTAGTSTSRFTVWRLMAITAIVSVMLAVARLAGEFALPLAIAILVAGFVSWAIHRPVAWLTNKWLDWRLARRRKKRAVQLANPPATPAAPSSS